MAKNALLILSVSLTLSVAAFGQTDYDSIRNKRLDLNIAEQKINTTSPQITSSQQDSIVTPPYKKESPKKKSRRHLVWTGWRTGWHWDTPGKY